MGVKNLWDILEPCKKTLPLHHLQNKRICIDLSCWMVQLANVNKSHCSMKDKLYLKGLFHRIRALIALNCSTIFVTDGSIPGIKVSTYRRRLQMNKEGILDESSSDKTTSLQRNMGSEFSCMIKEAKILGSALGVPCLDAIEEGEAQCALLDSELLCDGCFSSDSDIFLFGARTAYRDICLGEGGYVVCYEMADIETKLGLGRNSLIALAVLLGCDYSPGVRGLGPEMACQIIKSLGESAVLQRLLSEELSLLKRVNCSKKGNQVRKGFNNKENIPPNNNKENIPPNESGINRQKSNLPRNNQFLQVMDAYLKPKCHSADSQMVQRVLGMHPVQRIILQRTCHRFFEWPPEKTDEYILPKIAERELRRFANLRTTSSNLGVQLPLDEMPVRCPVSDIVKRRKAQGKECFEVLWEDIDGLSSSSIVPGDLVQSACPEKIVELEERLAGKKKPKPRKLRLKKTITNQSVNDVDSKLQELLLEIEGATSSCQNYRLLDETLVKTRSSSKENYQLLDERPFNTRTNIEETFGLPVVDMKSNTKEVKMTDEPAESCCDIESEVMNLSTPFVMKSNKKVETEIVDLLSPMSIVCSWKHQEDVNVDSKLQELLLEIKGATSSFPKSRLLDETLVKTRSSSKENYQLLDERPFNTRPNMEKTFGLPVVDMKPNTKEVKMTDEPAESCCDIECEVVNLSTPFVMKSNKKVETEIVDLLSPMSIVCSWKHQEDVDVIDLSESEMDVSPEHAKKAKELLFVAKIRNDFS